MKYKVGIDLGGTNINAGIVDENYQILREKSIPTLVGRPADEIIADMAALVSELIQTQGLDLSYVTGVGIGSPGMIDAEQGIVRYSNNFNWENIPLAGKMQSLLSLPVAVSNDANCAALGELKAGAARSLQNAILITLGTGVGGGIIINGRIFEGGHAGGAELGHTMLIAGGKPCTCGRQGCVEAYVSATALIRDTREAAAADLDSVIHELCGHDLNRVNGKTAFDAALLLDKTGKKVVDRYITHLGDAIADYVNIFRPDIVLLSGGVCNQGAVLTEPLNEYIRSACFSGDKAFIPPVKCAELGNSAGVIGAAALVEFIE